MSLTFKPLISSDSAIVRPWDTATQQYVLVSSVASGNDVQTVALSGPTASGTIALTFGGHTTAPIAFTATPPSKFALWQAIPVTPGVATELSLAALAGQAGFYTNAVFCEVIDGGVVTAVANFDPLDIGAGDFTAPNPMNGNAVAFKAVFPAYVPTSSTISLRMSNAGTGAFWDVDALGVKSGSSTRLFYDDGDATHFSSAGSQTMESPGSDGRFWDGSFTRFFSGSGAGMAYTMDPADAQAKLQALSSIGANNCTVTFAGTLRVEFTGTLGAEAQPSMSSASPGVTFPGHISGGSVPSIAETPSGGSPLAPVALRKPWIYEGGRMSAAVYQFAPDSITPHSTSSYTMTVPDGWLVTADGPLPGGTVAVDNRVDNHVLPPFVEGPKTMGMGYNVLSNSNYAEIQQHYNMACRISTAQTGFFNTNGPLAFNENLFPTFISPNGAQVIISEPPNDFVAQPLGPENTPNGLYTWYCNDPGHRWVLPGGNFTTGCTTVEAFPDTVVGDLKKMVRNIQVDPLVHRAPFIVMDWIGGAPTTFNGNPALPVTVDGLWIYPPDTDADPTGMTPSPYTPDTAPRWNPAFVRMGAGIKTLRTDQATLGVNISNTFADISDIRGETQLGRDDFTRSPIIGVGSMRQYTGAALDVPNYLQILVTTTGPHTLFSGAFVVLHQCGTATFSQGPPIDVTDGNLNFGLITVLSPTTFVWHAGQPRDPVTGVGLVGVTMTNVTSGGFLTASFGTGWTLADNADYANTCGDAELHFDFSACATDACIDAVADFMAANLNGKFCPELADEIWNFQFHPTEWVRIQGFQKLGLTTNGTVEAQMAMQNNISARCQARFEAAGRHDDVVFMVASTAADPGRTSSLLSYAQAHGYRIDRVAIQVYFQSIDRNASLSQAQGIVLPLGVKQDIMELWMDSFTSLNVAAHAAAIKASAYPDAELDGYEGGAETLIPTLTIGSGQGTNTNPDAYGSPTYIADQHAIHRHWRFFHLNLNWMQKCQDAGMSLINKFYMGWGAQGWCYSAREWWDSRDGTGDPSENPDPEAAHFLSQDGGAIAHWNSLVTTSPLLVVSPSTASAVDASTTASITATLSNSTAGLAASLTGSGTISTTAPTSGTPFTYTPPTIGSGSATVTVADSTDGLSKTCVISYSPAVVPTPTPIRIDRLRPFRRVRPAR